MGDECMKTKIILFAMSFFCCSVFNNALAMENKNVGAIAVEATPAQYQFFKKRITATGSLRANQGVTIRPEISGRVTQIFFKSGSLVKAGDPLVQLDKDIVSAKLQQSQAELELTKQNYVRTKKLYQTHDVSKAMLDDVFARYNEALAEVSSYEAQYNQALIKAPFSGRLGLSSINLGDYLEVGQKIVSIENIDPIEVEFSIPENYLNYIGVGQDISITSDSYKEQSFSGKVYALDAEIDVNNRSIAARASIPNTDNKLIPGGFVEVNLDLVSKNKVLIVPQTAVSYDVDQTDVYKIVAGKAVKTKVTLGERDKENVVVLNGLNDGDVVVTAGQLNIDNGSDVKVVSASK